MATKINMDGLDQHFVVVNEWVTYALVVGVGGPLEEHIELLGAVLVDELHVELATHH